MRYYRVRRGGERRLVVETGDRLADLTAARPAIGRFADVAAAASVCEVGVDGVAERLLSDAPTVERTALESLCQPVVPDEVWAAGVTYAISEEAREAESSMPDLYVDVYEGDRPEIFFKGTDNHTVGPGEDVGIRGDSTWDVPEPELGVVLYHGSVVGYTVGNDVSSRAIEGENPLYLPQAKVYDRCCALGPCVASAAHVGDPHDLEITIAITRDGETRYAASTTTAEMVRSCAELRSCYAAHNPVPELAVLLTGTALVPDEGFSLRPTDTVRIGVERLGTLTNGVREV
jgi:2-dehydro-3-deoxy-D-arabinonate dehydratase